MQERACSHVGALVCCSLLFLSFFRSFFLLPRVLWGGTRLAPGTPSLNLSSLKPSSFLLNPVCPGNSFPEPILPSFKQSFFFPNPACPRNYLAFQVFRLWEESGVCV